MCRHCGHFFLSGAIYEHISSRHTSKVARLTDSDPKVSVKACSSNNIQCSTCERVFPSIDKLHRHIRENRTIDAEHGRTESMESSRKVVRNGQRMWQNGAEAQAEPSHVRQPSRAEQGKKAPNRSSSLSRRRSLSLIQKSYKPWLSLIHI